MKYGLMTYDEDGNCCRPLWDGERWRYFRFERTTVRRRDLRPAVNDETGEIEQVEHVFEEPVRAAVEVDEPLPMPLRPVAKGYEGRIYIFQDDGTSPDPRDKPDPYVTVPIRVRYRSVCGRPLDAEDIRKDLHYLIQTKLERARRDVQGLARPVKRTMAEAEGVPETAHTHLVDEAEVDLLALCRAACADVEICCDCGPDEECCLPEGYVG